MARPKNLSVKKIPGAFLVLAHTRTRRPLFPKPEWPLEFEPECYVTAHPGPPPGEPLGVLAVGEVISHWRQHSKENAGSRVYDMVQIRFSLPNPHFDGSKSPSPELNPERLIYTGRFSPDYGPLCVVRPLQASGLKYLRRHGKARPVNGDRGLVKVAHPADERGYPAIPLTSVDQ